jgi:hypothetical protein
LPVKAARANKIRIRHVGSGQNPATRLVQLA